MIETDATTMTKAQARLVYWEEEISDSYLLEYVQNADDVTEQIPTCYNPWGQAGAG